MFKAGDKIKFVDVDTYKKRGGRTQSANLQLQEKIAGHTDTIIHIESISGTDDKLYYTSRKHYNGQDYFLADRFKKVEVISLDEELFEM